MEQKRKEEEKQRKKQEEQERKQQVSNFWTHIWYRNCLALIIRTGEKSFDGCAQKALLISISISISFTMEPTLQGHPSFVQRFLAVEGGDPQKCGK